MGEVKRVLFVSSEIYPYLPESPIGRIGRFLPQGVQERKREIRSFMPRYGCINERKNQLHEVIRLSGMNIVISEIDRPLVIKVASISSARMQVYFIDNDDYFHRKQIYCDENGKFFEDNGERAIFFARGVLETVKKLRWAPDVIFPRNFAPPPARGSAAAIEYMAKLTNKRNFFILYPFSSIYFQTPSRIFPPKQILWINNPRQILLRKQEISRELILYDREAAQSLLKRSSFYS